MSRRCNRPQPDRLHPPAPLSLPPPSSPPSNNVLTPSLPPSQSFARAIRLYQKALAGGVEHSRSSLHTLTQIRVPRQAPFLGRRVVLRGLSAEARNGVRGKCIDFGCPPRDLRSLMYSPMGWSGANSFDGRYTVKLEDGTETLVKVKAVNLAAVEG